MPAMRDRSGRSGRRRGSQKPGTASVLAGGVTVVGAGDTPCGGLAVCAVAGAIALAAITRPASAAMAPRLRR